MQKTIKNRTSVKGVGLHSGKEVTMTYIPAPEDHGIQFKRIDLEAGPIIKADVNNVTTVERGTTIEENGASVSTIEHALAALTGMGVDNVLIELDGPEVPILDGSSKLHIEALSEVGFQEQTAKKNTLSIRYPIKYKDEKNGVEIVAYPSDKFKVSVEIDFDNAIFGKQHASLNCLTEFKDEIANSRTFCFFHELEMLLNANLIKGGDLDNAIVFAEENTEKERLQRIAKLFNKEAVEVKKGGYLNNVDLTFENEPARHKLLDVIGDLSLIGSSLNAHIVAKRPGHKANVEFAKIIKKAMKDIKKLEEVPVYNPNMEPIFNSEEIARLLPHRYPFLLVDKVIEISDDHIVGLKNVTRNEEFFNGHFPGNPVMPGVLQIEAMAQTGGIMILNTVPDPENYDTYFLKIDKTRFKNKVLPGDTLLFKLELLGPVRRGIVEMKGTAYVGDKVVCEAVLMASIVKKADAK